MPKPSAEFEPPKAGQPCPCGTGRTFARCCQPLLQQARSADNAEELMRSRFTAHVARDYKHLHRTHFETSREPFVEEDNPEPPSWTRLVIHSHEPGARPDVAFVDFTAYYRKDDAEEPHHEKAEFKRIDGSWFYTRPVRQGPAPIRTEQPKVGRNAPCPCGSGKKYKQCCGKA